jgi:tetratricopeptide (TPR) repeat protein
VAGRIAAYQAAVGERLKEAEHARVAAEARAEEEQKRRELADVLARAERRRRRSVVALATAFVALVVTGGVALAWARARYARVDGLIDRAEELCVAAEQDEQGGDPALPRAALEQAGEALAGLPGSTRKARLDAIDVRIGKIARVRALVRNLEAVRGARAEHTDAVRTDRDYREAFRRFGLDLDAMAPEAAGREIARYAVAPEVAAALDEWALTLHEASPNGDPGRSRRLVDIARVADPCPELDALRAHFAAWTADELVSFARAERPATERPSTVVLLAKALSAAGEHDLAREVIRSAWRRSPGDFWVSFEAGIITWSKRLGHFDLPAEAAQYLSAAVAIRPSSVVAHVNLAVAYAELKELPDAVAELRKALELQPEFALAHEDLGFVLQEQGEYEGAVAESHEAVRLRPENAEAHRKLGNAYHGLGRRDEAIASWREAIRLDPGLALAHTNLGVALQEGGKLEEAAACHREAIRLGDHLSRADLALAYNNLGFVLRDLGRHDEAVGACREAVRLQPNFAMAFLNLGNALAARNELDEAVAAYREAIRIDPNQAMFHNNLGMALRAQGKLDEAVASCREAVRLQPDYALAYGTLATFLREQGKLDEALAEFRRCAEFAGPGSTLAQAAELYALQVEQQVALKDRLDSVLKGDDRPRDDAERLTLAQMCYDARKYAAAARFWSEVIEADPKLADDRQAPHRYNAACAAALAADGRGQDGPALDDAARAELRGRALRWLTEERIAWSKLLKAQPQARPVVAQTLEHWLKDADLMSVRDPEAMARLTDEERGEWRAFWDGVDRLLK